MNRRKVTIPICKAISKVCSDEMVARLVYRTRFGKSLNLDNPTTFNEKIIWLKLRYYPNQPLVVRCADKYQVRDYLTEKGYSGFLNELIQVWDSPEDIHWDELPKSFAMKCNHGMGYNFICPDITTVDLAEAKQNIERWYKEDFGYETSEPHYRMINRKIILERYVDSLGSYLPTDWQLFCFNGLVKMILVRIPSDQDGQQYSHYIFNENWQPLDFINNEAPKSIQRPKCLDELIEMTENLGKEFPFLRLDFYIEDEKPMFGEMTFTSSSGYSTTFSDEAQAEIGSWLDISGLESQS